MAEISFVVRVSNSGPLTSVPHLTRAAVEAEQMGFDSIFLHDHVVWSTDMRRRHIPSRADEALCDRQSADFFESLTTIGYLGDHINDAEIHPKPLLRPGPEVRVGGRTDATARRTDRVRDARVPDGLSPGRNSLWCTDCAADGVAA